jgi:hypothetical protein
MKKLFYLLILISFWSCTNQEVEFPDFEYNAVYFPLQYPVRTLILGDDRIDNALDKQLKFNIGASIGGMYNNTRTWSIDYQVDPTLAENLRNAKGEVISVLPSTYYTLTPGNKILIQPGSFEGLIEVQLKDEFLDDPKAITGAYVIPLRMVSSDADSILSGKPAVSNPNKNIASNWDPNAKPKDFVLFGIKYINPYHGAYFLRGKDVTYDASNNMVSQAVYRTKYVESNQIRKITTAGRNVCVVDGIGPNSGTGNSMKLSFSANGDVVVSEATGSSVKPTGTGKFVSAGGEWGGKKYNAIFLNYTYTVGANKHVVNDTLVFRNNGVVFEENVVTKF